MRNLIFTYLSLLTAIFLCTACADDDAFSTSRQDKLTFSVDTLKLDTCFSQVPTPTKTFWVYNNSGSNIRCSTIRLLNGNQTGYRVNVDGVYLGESRGYLLKDQEIRNKDSIRVFVELTSPRNMSNKPEVVKDDLVFSLESGLEQRVNLNAFSWDADLLRNITISNDTILSGERPTVIYGKFTVPENVKLTIAPGKTLYMNSDASIDVYGTLVSNGEKGNEIIFRGNRLDKMFDYLPYDGISGQWRGIHFYPSSYNNKLTYTDIHSAMDAITCDSSNVKRDKLTIANSTIHNNQGHGIKTTHSYVTINNSQLTNTLGDIVSIIGGDVELNGCTIAQFYPFDSNRGSALSFTNTTGEKDYPLTYFAIRNSIITGYADDVIMGSRKESDEELAYTFYFENCLLRTPAIEDSVNCVNVIWEDIADADSAGVKNFVNVDAELQRYDFHLAKTSKAIGQASVRTAPKYDRDGLPRDASPDMGCYEFVPTEEEKDTAEEGK